MINGRMRWSAIWVPISKAFTFLGFRLLANAYKVVAFTLIVSRRYENAATVNFLLFAYEV